MSRKKFSKEFKLERIKDHELFTGMNWFAEGVEIYE